MKFHITEIWEDFNEFVEYKIKRKNKTYKLFFKKNYTKFKIFLFASSR